MGCEGVKGLSPKVTEDLQVRWSDLDDLRHSIGEAPVSEKLMELLVTALSRLAFVVREGGVFLSSTENTELFITATSRRRGARTSSALEKTELLIPSAAGCRQQRVIVLIM